MNSILEKEKKLSLALTKLKNLNLDNPDIKKNIETLSEQKNQLSEIISLLMSNLNEGKTI